MEKYSKFPQMCANPWDKETPNTEASRKYGQALTAEASSWEKMLNSWITQETQTQQPCKCSVIRLVKTWKLYIWDGRKRGPGSKKGTFLEVLVAKNKKCKWKYPDLNTHTPHKPTYRNLSQIISNQGCIEFTQVHSSQTNANKEKKIKHSEKPTKRKPVKSY